MRTETRAPQCRPLPRPRDAPGDLEVGGLVLAKRLNQLHHCLARVNHVLIMEQEGGGGEWSEREIRAAGRQRLVVSQARRATEQAERHAPHLDNQHVAARELLEAVATDNLNLAGRLLVVVALAPARRRGQPVSTALWTEGGSHSVLPPKSPPPSSR